MGAKKQYMKKTEARILVYLTTAAKYLRYTSKISEKLNIDYIYCIRILKGMRNKNWIYFQRSDNKNFYFVKAYAPIWTAKKVLSDKGQRRLKCRK